MKVADYVKLNVILTGGGKVASVGLNASFFSWVADSFGVIEDVMELSSNVCGVYGTFNDNVVKGCIIKLVGGRVLWIQSDGRYINFGATRVE